MRTKGTILITLFIGLLLFYFFVDDKKEVIDDIPFTDTISMLSDTLGYFHSESDTIAVTGIAIYHRASLWCEYKNLTGRKIRQEVYIGDIFRGNLISDQDPFQDPDYYYIGILDIKDGWINTSWEKTPILGKSFETYKGEDFAKRIMYTHLTKINE